MSFENANDAAVAERERIRVEEARNEERREELQRRAEERGRRAEEKERVRGERERMIRQMERRDVDAYLRGDDVSTCYF